MKGGGSLEDLDLSGLLKEAQKLQAVSGLLLRPCRTNLRNHGPFPIPPPITEKAMSNIDDAKKIIGHEDCPHWMDDDFFCAQCAKVKPVVEILDARDSKPPMSEEVQHALDFCEIGSADYDKKYPNEGTGMVHVHIERLAAEVRRLRGEG